MADLSVEFAGLKLKNPFIIASSDLTNKIDKIKTAEENGATPGHCECIEIIDKKAVLVKPKECYSCAVCYFLCLRDALHMKKVPIEETRAGVANIEL